MEEMNALFTPPGRDGKNRNKVEMHPYYKRPGKGHNHDCCDACGEGGDLICCDNCPASFHFTCHAPPLEEEDIPLGDWICLRCYYKEQSRLGVASATASVVTPLSSGTDTGGAATPSSSSDGGQEGNNSRSSRGRPARGGAAKKQQEAAMKAEQEKKIKIYKLKYQKYLILKPTTNSPFDALIKATQVSNAEQFKLPDELEPREQLPFSWKWSDERQDDFSTYPKNCCVCSKTSRGVPSVACDFCVSVYHLDCLDPPLCEMPRERWMCPNHVEQFIDSKLVGSTSLTERLKLWNKYARDPINVDSVRLEFFRKVRHGKLRQRCRLQKVAKPPDFRIKVPDFVKAQYQYRMPGFPQANQQQQPPAEMEMDLSSLRRELDKDTKQQETTTEALRLTDGRKLSKDQEEWLSCLVSIQNSIIKEETKNELEDNAGQKKKKKKKTKKKKKKIQKKDNVEKQKNSCEETNGTLSSMDDDEAAGGDSDTAESTCSTDSECSLGLDVEDAVPVEAQEEIMTYLARNAQVANVSSLDPHVRDFLAMQRIKQLFAKHTTDLDAATGHGGQVRARAALLPLDMSSRTPCLIRYRTIDIGLGNQVHLDLSKYGFCHYVSSRHSSIFYDQYTRVYELINYSDHGTVVDNVIYSVEAHHMPSQASRQKFERLKKMASEVTESEANSACHCSTSAARLNANKGCEVSAVLHHGSYIRFGCLQFVFCVLDYDSDDSVPTSTGEEEEQQQKEPEQKKEEDVKMEDDEQKKTTT